MKIPALCLLAVSTAALALHAVPAAAAEDSIYKDALNDPSRPDADRARDAGRMPGSVLEFVGIEPGMAVLDMFSGSGYYTELLSHVVGDEGHVVAHMNKAYIGWVGEAFENRYLGGRLPNTEVLMAENNELALEPARFDAILLILSYHDLYYVDPDNGWPAFDVQRLLAELHKGLRDDGVIGIVDHRAAPGSPAATGGTLHRIAPAIVIADMQAAGFELEEQAEFLRNTDDDHNINVFDPAVQGKTDRFVMRFRKAH